jgi:mono/diheme cytochrome c family protein/plastocyanin
MLIFGFAQLTAPRVRHVNMHGVVAEAGGWTPANFSVGVGDQVRIHLTSGDMLHGFAIGQMDIPAVDVRPGQPREFNVIFARPGKYVFSCTQWCGLGHWRMRGVIEVLPASNKAQQGTSGDRVPLYVQLGLNIDVAQPVPVTILPATRPSAARGQRLGITLQMLPAEFISLDYLRSHSPAQVWQALRSLSVTRALSDADVWDLTAYVWASPTTSQTLAAGQQLYAANCAACHGERGAGDGPMASVLASQSTSEFGSSTLTPTAFTDPSIMLGASPARLQGKIIRGGMGTGMPYWGPVFSDPQVWAIIDYLWTFQMEPSNKP